MNTSEVPAESWATIDELSMVGLDTADRVLVERVIARIGEFRAQLAAIEVRCSRRTRELAAAGRSGPAESTLRNKGRSTSKDAAEAAERERVCSTLGGFEDALAAGDVAAGHLDALARATKRADEDTIADLTDQQADLVDTAAASSVDAFERHVRELVKRLEAERSKSDADELDRQRAASRITRFTDKATGMRHTRIELDPLRDAALWNALDAQIARSRQADGNANTPWQQLQVDTLIATVKAGANPVPANDDDDSGGPVEPVPEAMLLVDHHTLVHGLWPNTICELDDGTPIPLSTMRRMLCDCNILPVVLSGTGEAMDVGRAKRTATRPQRRALRAMHRTCAHPDCTVPFAHCRIHHIRWWWNHLGPTNLDNLIPLCERHHHLVHEGGWTLTMTPDRVATWTRPDGTIARHGTTINRAPNGIGPTGTGKRRVKRPATPPAAARTADPDP